jgi:esterase/lipase superfamily enzyme
MTFERYQISIPPTHKAPEIEWQNGKPDARRDFVVTQRQQLDRARFQALAGQAASDGTVGLFVHGFNNSYQEGLFRLAQVAADAHTEGTPVLFSWPSEGAITGYVADKDGVLYARSHLVGVIKSIAAARGVKRIVLFAHSMGSFLVMESLQQLRLEQRRDILDRLAVVLAAPDIDADVFRSQLDVIGPMHTPITLFVAKDDKALAVSSFVGGERTRVGRLDVADPRVKDAAAKYHIRIVDITSSSAPDELGHDRFAGLAQVGPQLVALQPQNGSVASRTGVFVFDSASQVVSAPFRLAGAIVGAR